jgi:hypothetical protein
MPRKKYKLNLIAVDFDDTICFGINEDDPSKDAYTFDMNAIRILKNFQKRGGSVILWTCRSGDSLARAVNELAGIGFYPDYVNYDHKSTIVKWGDNGRKVYADLYIDEKNSIDRKVDWDTIEEWLQRREENG